MPGFHFGEILRRYPGWRGHVRFLLVSFFYTPIGQNGFDANGCDPPIKFITFRRGKTSITYSPEPDPGNRFVAQSILFLTFKCGGFWAVT